MTTLNRSTGRSLAGSGILGTVILTIVVLAAGAAFAQGPGMGAGKGSGKGEDFRLERLAARLDLTAEQQEAIAALHDQNRAKAVPLRKELMRLRNELQGELLKDDPSEKAVLSLNQKMGGIKTELKANRLQTRLAVREQLTPEQRDKMLLMEQHRPRGERGCEGPRPQGREGRHGGRGPGQGPGSGQRDGTGPRAGVDCPQAQQ